MPASWNCFAYVRRGTLSIATDTAALNGNIHISSESQTQQAQRDAASKDSSTAVATHCMVYFNSDGNSVKLDNRSSKDPLDLMLFAGEPLREPRAAAGSFVMSTEAVSSEIYMTSLLSLKLLLA